MVSTPRQVDSDDPSATVTGGEIQRADVHQWETTAGRVGGAKTAGVDFNKNVTCPGEHKCRCNRMLCSKVWLSKSPPSPRPSVPQLCAQTDGRLTGWRLTLPKQWLVRCLELQNDFYLFYFLSKYLENLNLMQKSYKIPRLQLLSLKMFNVFLKAMTRIKPSH